jgi:hypothetical protein
MLLQIFIDRFRIEPGHVAKIEANAAAGEGSAAVEHFFRKLEAHTDPASAKLKRRSLNRLWTATIRC